jgi:signal transduction histidine kinase
VSARGLSISTRLALWYGLSLTLLLGVVVAFLYTGFHLTLHRDFDADLAREAERLAAALPPGEGTPTGPLPADFVRAAEASPHAVRLLSWGGAVLFANGRLPELSVRPPTGAEGGFHTHGDGSIRTRYEPVPTSRGEPSAWIAVAGVESGLHREMHRLGWLLVVGVVLGVLVAALSGYGLARRALRPVAALTDAAGRIGPTQRGARLPTAPGPRDELGDLAAAFNALLARLDDAVERERRFRADAAHELLTPVTAARSEVDVALRRDRDPEAYRIALHAIGGHVDRMAGLITGLLALSRAEAAGIEPAGAADVAEVARDLMDRVSRLARSKGVRLTLEIEEPATASAPRAHVETALVNLVDNAIKYTPSGGRVELSVWAEHGEAVVAVADTGAGFSAAERERLFGRFYRADAPEVRRERGSGLGLAIAQRLAELNGGRITAASAGPGEGSVFELRLPRAPHAD